MIDFLSMEPSTRAILLFMRTLGHACAFMSAAQAATRNKPVLIVKAMGHPEVTSTGSAQTRTLIRSDAIYAAAFRRAGMLQVQDTEELFAAVETLAHSGPSRRDDLTIMTNSEGIGARAIDSLSQGGSLTRLGDETLARLDALLPTVRPRGNPVNIRADATGERYADVLRVLIAAQEVDTILVLHTPTAMAAAEAVVRVVSETGGNVLIC